MAAVIQLPGRETRMASEVDNKHGPSWKIQAFCFRVSSLSFCLFWRWPVCSLVLYKCLVSGCAKNKLCVCCCCTVVDFYASFKRTFTVVFILFFHFCSCSVSALTFCCRSRLNCTWYRVKRWDIKIGRCSVWFIGRLYNLISSAWSSVNKVMGGAIVVLWEGIALTQILIHVHSGFFFSSNTSSTSLRRLCIRRRHGTYRADMFAWLGIYKWWSSLPDHWEETRSQPQPCLPRGRDAVPVPGTQVTAPPAEFGAQKPRWRLLPSHLGFFILFVVTSWSW